MLLALLLLNAAADPTATPTKAIGPTSGFVGKVICRNDERDTTSRIPIRVCRTEAEWDNIYKQTQEDLRNSRNDRTFLPRPTPDR